ncbi:unnamed protein product [Leptidea sinapis]|uniref:Uncharacterized protein n=1 Tax=Leptidea sinapis TaxID=189913 RepID=A0A5E4R577_9NEOP|nr:unnamed protein product [Leptidea sinapis]
MLISTICEWNPLIIITEEDYICDACNQLAMQYVNSPHPLVATYMLHFNPSRLQQSIHIEFENRIAPRPATSSDYVMHVGYDSKGLQCAICNKILSKHNQCQS